MGWIDITLLFCIGRGRWWRGGNWSEIECYSSSDMWVICNNRLGPKSIILGRLRVVRVIHSFRCARARTG